MLRRLIAALIGFASLAPASQIIGQDFVPVHETALADTKQKAMHEAYYAAFKRQLAKVVRHEEAGKVGARFRADFERDFDVFKSRYFMPETKSRCVPQEAGEYLCEVEGTLDFGALQTDVLPELHPVVAQPTFALTTAQSKDHREKFVFDKLEGAFASWGLHILLNPNQAIERNTVDFGLGIYEITFDLAAYDPYNLQLSGSLTLRFKLSHQKSNRVVASVPIVVSASQRGPDPNELRPLLVQALSQKAADEIARNVNEAVVRFNAEEGRATK